MSGAWAQAHPRFRSAEISSVKDRSRVAPSSAGFGDGDPGLFDLGPPSDDQLTTTLNYLKTVYLLSQRHPATGHRKPSDQGFAGTVAVL